MIAAHNHFSGGTTPRKVNIAGVACKNGISSWEPMREGGFHKLAGEIEVDETSIGHPASAIRYWQQWSNTENQRLALCLMKFSGTGTSRTDGH